MATPYNNRHIFNFEGGDDLTTMGASWFISYLYYKTIDSKHQNWKKIKTANNRIICFEKTQNKVTKGKIPMHRHYVNQICAMSIERLSTNKIGLRGEEVIRMAKKIQNSNL